MKFRLNFANALAAAATAIAAVPAVAAPVAITGYDIYHTSTSGAGGWGHIYTGAITSDGAGRFNYTGGSGTMNNGVVETNPSETQLLDSSGGNLSIVLHLGGFYTLNSLTIFGGDFSNLIPPALGGMTIDFGGTNAVFALSSFGPNFGAGQTDHLATIAGSALDGVATDTITLSGFTGANCCGLQFFPAIAEITLDGQPGTPAGRLPEPGTLALAGLALAAGLKRRKAA